MLRIGSVRYAPKKLWFGTVSVRFGTILQESIAETPMIMLIVEALGVLVTPEHMCSKIAVRSCSPPK